MEELLKSLQKKCRVECEEAHRQLVCALNGRAGIHIIRGEYLEAVEMYREVLRSSEEHKGRLKTDSLQRLHATHNLMELLKAKHSGIPPTLRDDRLSDEAEQLRQHYMTKYDSEVSDALQALQPVLQSIKELRRKVKLNSPWWLEVVQRAVRCSTDDELVSRIKNDLTSSYKQQASRLSMADKFRDAVGLQLLLTSQVQDLMKSQKTVQDAVKKLEGPASREVIEEVTVCHLRPQRLPLNNCVFCKADVLFIDYESKLFSHTVKGQTAIFEEMIEDQEGGLMDDRLPTTSRGLWAASETEKSLKAILAFAKLKRLDNDLLEEGNTFMELLECWKKEYKVLHEYWMVLRNHVSAIDELGMATERLRVRLPDESKPKLLHIIEPTSVCTPQVDQNQQKLLNDQALAKSQLQKKLGQVLYLNNLEKSQDKSNEELNPEPCPICARPLGKEWAVLTCGHCFCNECISIMVEQYSVGSRRRAIRCAVCRQITSHAEISYVFTTQASGQDQDIPVQGSHSTKVEAVVRTLKKIQLIDPGAKCLVFSTALFDNNMEFSQINGIHKFQENLCSFKYEEQINILLLPLHTGSNGLNIIEATHVLLVEPILNPAHELQAIGRVHRIGQTKPTFVHRFLIKSTIEERMQAMMQTAEKSHATTMKHSEAAVLTVADLADLTFYQVTDSRLQHVWYSRLQHVWYSGLQHVWYRGLQHVWYRGLQHVWYRGLQHVWYRGLQHVWYSGLQHVWYSGLQHVWYSGLQHVWYSGLQHVWYSGLQHVWYSGLQHGWYSGLQHGWYSGLQHVWYSGLQHVWDSGLQHVWYSGLQHGWYSGLQHVWDSRLQHVWYSGLQHVWYSGLQHVWYSGLQHVWKEAIDLSLPSVQNNANPVQPTPSDLHDKAAPDPASW
ncbi:E3 ubiquitin-protein ligase SHPRH [Dissostichus eleginoides]|uniref:E3 ubiquitin-protein ligase SHPRH n=1 Tax=Dissostichus eleginoides TaxID=100907 RepID=A0AAD9C4S2_DISEL|nr:E3 ubiquitin-protein ligase SHPRH [Dissostichus eleginoides]